MNPRKNIMRWLIVALALFAVAATGAQAGTRPNDRAGTLGVGSPRISGDTSDVVSRYLRSHAIRPNDRAGSLEANSAAATAPDVFERYSGAHPYGVGTGIALVLLLAGGLITTPVWRRQHRQPAIG
jgi:hypothetical protein